MSTSLDGIRSEVINLYKRRSETPLQTIERHVKSHPEYKGVKMTYAGRLDPMAEGVLVVLSGEKNKEREAYTGLDKDYEFEFAFGVETDTFDVLGKIVATSDAERIAKERVDAGLRAYLGEFEQKYPPYSSKVVNGTPLYELSRKGLLHEEDIPSHKVSVRKIELLSSRTISKDDLVEFIYRTVSAVSGDFRQSEILKAWNMYFSERAPEETVIYKARVSCGSGFYVRQLVSDLGKALGPGAVTISIVRTRVGEYRIEDSIR
ncbi:MAG: hypothetical protein HZA81_01800 [Candidatus Taylorbacteria bacterium]|nr:hypothetical protein [Candidatus Taylorbacteria bacterium]